MNLKKEMNINVKTKETHYSKKWFTKAFGYRMLEIVALKVMKRAASCKHRQAVKTIQCEKKLFNSHLHSS